MSGHLSFPEITGNRIPATFCPYFLDDLLRKQLGFDGLIITDDIMMNGATDYAGSVSRVVELAIEAGNNIVESSTTPSFSDPLWRNTLNRMKRDEQFRARVEDSVLRVLVTKLGYFKGTNPVGIYPEIADIADRVPDPTGLLFSSPRRYGRSPYSVTEKNPMWTRKAVLYSSPANSRHFLILAANGFPTRPFSA